MSSLSFVLTSLRVLGYGRLLAVKTLNKLKEIRTGEAPVPRNPCLLITVLWPVSIVEQSTSSSATNFANSTAFLVQKCKCTCTSCARTYSLYTSELVFASLPQKIWAVGEILILQGNTTICETKQRAQD
eukprot:TRINITY_DN76587_c0_g1_i1.p1 TRINITY_DN76587_c0_g1~~TRINITY_DN76587_c0_g1_i1.p1  ORF type:complete len:129 (+),score=3.70 TRINITY_DN76587_c0_g1_i1:180-566(+)